MPVLRVKVVRFLNIFGKNHVFQQNSKFGEGIDLNNTAENSVKVLKCEKRPIFTVKTGRTRSF